MLEEIEKQLENFKYESSSLPVLVYKVENVDLNGSRYLKFYLINKSKEKIDKLRIDFNINGFIYETTFFSKIKEYNNPNIIGCVIKLNDNYDGIDYEILNENLNDLEYKPQIKKIEVVEIIKEEIVEDTKVVEEEIKPIEKEIVEDKPIIKELEKEKPKAIKTKKKSRFGVLLLILVLIIGIIGALLCFKSKQSSEEVKEVYEIDSNSIEVIKNINGPEKDYYTYLNEGNEEKANTFLKYIEAEKELYSYVENGPTVLTGEGKEKFYYDYSLLLTKGYNFVRLDNDILSTYIDSAEIEDKLYFGRDNSYICWSVLSKRSGSLLVIYNGTLSKGSYMPTLQQSADGNREVEWWNSNIRQYLYNYYLSSFNEIESTKISSHLVGGEDCDYLYLLSEDEYRKYEKHISAIGLDWWLRDKGHALYSSKYVSQDDFEVHNENVTFNLGVRPVMWLEISNNTNSCEEQIINEVKRSGMSSNCDVLLADEMKITNFKIEENNDYYTISFNYETPYEYDIGVFTSGSNLYNTLIEPNEDKYVSFSISKEILYNMPESLNIIFIGDKSLDNNALISFDKPTSINQYSVTKDFSNLNVGDNFFFGKNIWTVLDKKDETIFVICDDCKHHMIYSSKDSYSWSNSLVKEYLNDEFLESFNNEEKDKIIEKEELGKIYILSDEEFKNYQKLISNVKEWWWLRSPGWDEYSCAYVTEKNILMKNDVDVSPTQIGGKPSEFENLIRPVMWLDVSNK